MELNNWFWRSFALVVGIYFLTLSLIEAQIFLAPLATAVILSLVMLPVANRIELFIKKRSRVSLICTFGLFLISLFFIGLILYQVQIFFDDWPQLKETLEPKWNNLKAFLVENTPLQQSDLKLEKSASAINSSEENQNSNPTISALLTQVFSFLGNFLLTFIYIFFLLNYRHHFKKFLVQIFPDKRKKEVNRIISESAQVAPKYLSGKAILIGILIILYTIGLGVSGVENFILVSILAAVFSLIPYLGNLIGFFIAVALGYASTGDSAVLIGIILTFSIAQFIESYILEPYIIGDQVDVHPFFIIVVVIIGNLMWGIIGMILFIPILAILIVIMMHIPPLKPLAELLGGNKSKSHVFKKFFQRFK